MHYIADHIGEMFDSLPSITQDRTRQMSTFGRPIVRLGLDTIRIITILHHILLYKNEKIY